MKLSDQKSHAKRHGQLGMPFGTASAKLRKALLFKLVQDANKDSCHHCGLKIETIDDLSIEHVTPWLDNENAKELFFDVNNIAFSHLKCNIGAARKTNQKYFSPEERLEADRKISRERAKRFYTAEKRRHKYRTTGH